MNSKLLLSTSYFQGFCHISISVPDIEIARNRAKSLDVEIVEEGSNSKLVKSLENQLLSTDVASLIEITD